MGLINVQGKRLCRLRLRCGRGRLAVQDWRQGTSSSPNDKHCNAEYVFRSPHSLPSKLGASMAPTPSTLCVPARSPPTANTTDASPYQVSVRLDLIFTSRGWKTDLSPCLSYPARSLGLPSRPQDVPRARVDGSTRSDDLGARPLCAPQNPLSRVVIV